MRLGKLAVFLGFCGIVALLAVFLFRDEPFECRLDCSRASGTCTFTQRFLTKSQSGSAPIDSLGRAEVRVYLARRSLPRVEVWVTASRGDAYFADYNRRRDADAAAQRINAFLRNPGAERFSLTRNDRRMYWTAWGSLAAVVPLLGLLGYVLFSGRWG